ncbi:MAG: CerR family C-terminal domain-containing protein [Deltaproteobacteria bacterium]|jgi:AcrR family transcriptional regulator|nr:CerR family C-terminal domain-containing protein [Deltaproteobacteria bacterium]MBW2512603.1 CerR family C-terminal domain-containing protein [Deltaproteobacteria bacterium]MDH4007443.1 CerR family C-terminal domain-containing protein [Desulfuromonadales bacterium]
MSQPDTKQRILDAAEHLFARNGYHATSLRGITTTADANLAAVNYHFGSKEALLEAVIVRRLDPLNEIRRGQLEALLQKAELAGELPSCREVLRAFVEPTLRLRQQGSEAEDFIALIGRTLAEPRGIAMSIFLRHMQPLLQRIFQALALSLPALTEQDLFWRMHFTMGCLSHIMRCHERYSMVPDNVNIDLPVDELIEHFLDFTTAGMEVAR